jgi:hypothetical protein
LRLIGPGVSVTLGAVLAARDLNVVPRVDRAAIRLLWHDDFWDGPTSGMLRYQGEDFWFQMFEESEDEASDWYRRFLIVRLSADQLADERYWHELFRENVGTHADYDEHGHRPVGSMKPKDRWGAFYGPYRQRTSPDLTENEVVGWWES